jgi:hypothetical protein
MERRQITFGGGIQWLNYLALRFLEILGHFKAKGTPNPYYSATKWPDPLPRDTQLRLQELLQMLQVQLIGRAQVLRECIHENIAPEELDVTKVDQVIQEAMQESIKYQGDLAAAQAPPPAPPMTNANSAAETSSTSAETKAMSTV